MCVSVCVCVSMHLRNETLIATCGRPGTVNLSLSLTDHPYASKDVLKTSVYITYLWQSKYTKCDLGPSCLPYKSYPICQTN